MGGQGARHRSRGVALRREWRRGRRRLASRLGARRRGGRHHSARHAQAAVRHQGNGDQAARRGQPALAGGVCREKLYRAGGCGAGRAWHCAPGRGRVGTNDRCRTPGRPSRPAAIRDRDVRPCRLPGGPSRSEGARGRRPGNAADRVTGRDQAPSGDVSKLVERERASQAAISAVIPSSLRSTSPSASSPRNSRPGGFSAATSMRSACAALVGSPG